MLQFTRDGFLPRLSSWDQLMELVPTGRSETEQEEVVIEWIESPDLDVDGHGFISQY